MEATGRNHQVRSRSRREEKTTFPGRARQFVLILAIAAQPEAERRNGAKAAALAQQGTGQSEIALPTAGAANSDLSSVHPLRARDFLLPLVPVPCTACELSCHALCHALCYALVSLYRCLSRRLPVCAPASQNSVAVFQWPWHLAAHTAPDPDQFVASLTFAHTHTHIFALLCSGDTAGRGTKR